MRALIAIISCESYRVNGNNQALRDTWLPLVSKETGLDYKIFMGQGSKVEKEDEVFLDVPDDYQHISYKGREVHRYALKHDYDFIYKCYPDTYLCPSRLMSSGFEKYDYVGNFACKLKSGQQYCTGGTGYWLSKKAYSLLIGCPIPRDITIEPKRPLRQWSRSPITTPSPKPIRVVDTLMWADDMWAGLALSKYPELKRFHDLRYEEDVYSSGPEKSNAKISLHLSRATREGQSALYDKQWMYDKHNNWLKPLSKIRKVAVITPSLPSRKELLSECKESVLKQDWNGEIYHVVGVDKDGKGPSQVRNELISSLGPEYEWIAFVDDDDKLLPNHISTLVDNSSEADIVYSDCFEDGFTKTWRTRAFNYDAIKSDNYIPITVLMRREVFEKVGGFSTEPPGEDQWLFLNAASAGARFKYVPKETWVYRKHPQHRELPPRPFRAISRIITG
jgi:hypothetical protein